MGAPTPSFFRGGQTHGIVESAEDLEDRDRITVVPMCSAESPPSKVYPGIQLNCIPYSFNLCSSFWSKFHLFRTFQTQDIYTEKNFIDPEIFGDKG